MTATHEIERLEARLQARAAAPMLVQLHQLGEQLAQEETDRALTGLHHLSDMERQIVRDMAQRLVRRVRTKEAYDEALVNTVLVLPSVVTAILIVVQSSLALAFSLTGIVAAVRFRTNLKDSRDALYVFAGVAIGFATGVHEPEVAAAASLLFVLLELFAWRSGLGGHRAHDQAFLRGDTPDAAAPSQMRLSWGTLGDRPDKQGRDGIPRVEATDIDEGKPVGRQSRGVGSLSIAGLRARPRLAAGSRHDTPSMASEAMLSPSGG